ncbi:hypothetical protein BDL97_05G007100 [Sphagnum fallax]|nr:hypothetical protein BDL97_05G007100 [Sphagnum fallax]
MAGWMMRGGWGHSSWLVTVITLLAILELHDMDQMEISKCIQEAQFHGRQLLHHTPPNPIQSPPNRWTYNGLRPGLCPPPP